MKLRWKSNRNSNIFIQENAFESVVWEMASILSRPQFVNDIMTWKRFPQNKPFVMGIHRWPVDSSQKGSAVLSVVRTNKQVIWEALAFVWRHCNVLVLTCTISFLVIEWWLWVYHITTNWHCGIHRSPQNYFFKHQQFNISILQRVRKKSIQICLNTLMALMSCHCWIAGGLDKMAPIWQTPFTNVLIKRTRLYSD